MRRLDPEEIIPVPRDVRKAAEQCRFVAMGCRVVGTIRLPGKPRRKDKHMKRLVESEEGGFEAALGTKVTLFCGIYIYTGLLAGVNADHLELAEPSLVYETGNLKSDDWADAQALPSPWRVMRQAIESWGPAKC